MNPAEWQNTSFHNYSDNCFVSTQGNLVCNRDFRKNNNVSLESFYNSTNDKLLEDILEKIEKLKKTYTDKNNAFYQQIKEEIKGDIQNVTQQKSQENCANSEQIIAHLLTKIDQKLS